MLQRVHVSASRVVFLQFAGRAAGVLKPRLDGAGIFPYLVDMSIDIGIRHGQADKIDRPEVFLAKILSPVGRNVAALDNKILPVLDGGLNHLAHDGPEVFRKCVIILRCMVGVSAADEPHLQVID